MAPAIRCLAPELKQLLHDQTGDPRIGKIPDCENGEAIGFSKRGGGGTRAPSAYNLYMGACIKERPPGMPVPERMKSCAVEWKKRKG